MLRRLTFVTFLCLTVVACSSNRPSASGITIPQSDGSAPTASLQAGATASGGESAGVSNGGQSQAMALHERPARSI